MYLSELPLFMLVFAVGMCVDFCSRGVGWVVVVPEQFQ